MKTASRPAFAVGVLALAFLSVAAFQGCSSATQSTDPNATSAQGGTAGDPQQGSAGTAGMPMGGSGGSTAGTDPPGPVTCDAENIEDLPFECELKNPDASCNSSDASTGAACTIDCRLGCGFDEAGRKHCQCEGGTYARCPCDRPANYQGTLTATFCGEGIDGRIANFDDNPCDTEWAQCIGTDPVTGTARGCACMTSSETGELQWFCGSTNNWFDLISETGDGACEGDNPDPRCAGINPDESCNSSNARTGSPCTQGCLVGCGYQRMGLKSCECGGGAYSTCPCLRPDAYMGAPTAPDCDTKGSPDGSADALDDLPCEVEWDQCIGNDPITGTTPRGCACIMNRISQQLQWYCGSTNRWFQPE